MAPAESVRRRPRMSALSDKLIADAGNDPTLAAKPVLAQLIQQIIQIATDLTEDQINILVDACHQAASEVRAGDSLRDVWNKVLTKLGPEELTWAETLGGDILDFIGSAIKAVASIFGL